MKTTNFNNKIKIINMGKDIKNKEARVKLVEEATTIHLNKETLNSIFNSSTWMMKMKKTNKEKLMESLIWTKSIMM